jgi:hypothetical protein
MGNFNFLEFHSFFYKFDLQYFKVSLDISYFRTLLSCLERNVWELTKCLAKSWKPIEKDPGATAFQLLSVTSCFCALIFSQLLMKCTQKMKDYNPGFKGTFTLAVTKGWGSLESCLTWGAFATVDDPEIPPRPTRLLLHDAFRAVGLAWE